MPPLQLLKNKLTTCFITLSLQNRHVYRFTYILTCLTLLPGKKIVKLVVRCDEKDSFPSFWEETKLLFIVSQDWRVHRGNLTQELPVIKNDTVLYLQQVLCWWTEENWCLFISGRLSSWCPTWSPRDLTDGWKRTDGACFSDRILFV